MKIGRLEIEKYPHAEDGKPYYVIVDAIVGNSQDRGKWYATATAALNRAKQIAPLTDTDITEIKNYLGLTNNEGK